MSATTTTNSTTPVTGTKRERLSDAHMRLAADMRARGDSWQEITRFFKCDSFDLTVAIQALGPAWDQYLAKARQELVEAAGIRALLTLDQMVDRVEGRDRIRVCEAVVKVWLHYKRYAALPSVKLHELVTNLTNQLGDRQQPTSESSDPAPAPAPEVPAATVPANE